MGKLLTTNRVLAGTGLISLIIVFSAAADAGVFTPVASIDKVHECIDSNLAAGKVQNITAIASLDPVSKEPVTIRYGTSSIERDFFTETDTRRKLVTSSIITMGGNNYSHVTVINFPKHNVLFDNIDPGSNPVKDTATIEAQHKAYIELVKKCARAPA